ncbi:MAG: DUF934 domain-containing protein [Phyllobacteriaceae bacterium]|nr:DUF934 domain-containing protein [Phyllobacteriaceae bacterium]
MSARLYAANGFVDDGFAELVPLATFLEAPGNTAAVLLEPDSRLEGLVPLLGQVALIAIRFPKFSDGRGYSVAARLRLHHGYSGVLRATGDVLIDQVQFFFRCGFDQLAVTHGPTLQRLESGATPVHSHFMQPDVGASEAAPAIGHAYSWRRAG